MFEPTPDLDWEVLEVWPCRDCGFAFREHNFGREDNFFDPPRCYGSGFEYEAHGEWDPGLRMFVDDVDNFTGG